MTAAFQETGSKRAAPPEASRPALVWVAGPGWSADELRALTAVGALWGFALRNQSGAPDAGAVAVIERGGSPVLKGAALPALRFRSDAVPLTQEAPPASAFARHGWLPEELRGQVVGLPASDRALPPCPTTDASPLLSRGGFALWSLSGGPGDGPHLVQVAAPAPVLTPSQTLSEVFNGEKFFDVLPVWLFFRALALRRDGGRHLWNPPLRRACLVVDDPNLHAMRYGHIDYAELAARAREWGFHAAMATVPLDQWTANPRAAALFRDQAAVLSLLVHGNDHTRGELASHAAPDACAALAAGALKRTAALERRAGVAVDRVMAPPHGVCSAAMVEALAEAGFDGITTNRWSLWKHIPAVELGSSSGFRPATAFPPGITIVNRYRFNSAIGKQEALFAALMGQPVIPYGHHQDFAGGMSAVRRAVDEVNSIGGVAWMSMRRIFETNYEWRVAGDALHVRPFSRRIVVPLNGAPQLQVEADVGHPMPLDCIARWRGAAGAAETPLRAGAAVPVPAGATEAEVFLPARIRSSAAATHHRTPLSVRLRRLASEARDRLKL